MGRSTGSARRSPDDKRDFVYEKLHQWGMSMILIAPVTAWAIFVLPGWL